MSIRPDRVWKAIYYTLLIAFVITAALNMLDVKGGFFTNYAADIVVPAWLYVVARRLQNPTGRSTVVSRTLGRSPEIAALGLFVASTLTELSQRYWPHGIFSGRFDLLDIVAYASGLIMCYVLERIMPVTQAAPSSKDMNRTTLTR